MKAPSPTITGTVFEPFSLIDDPRAANARHSLEVVLFCLVVAVLCGADGFVQAEHYARLKKRFIGKYVRLEHGVPTHDTMARVLAVLDPDQFASAFAAFMEKLTGHRAQDIINIDGKALRGVVGLAATRRSPADAANDQVQIVSALSTLKNVVIGQLRTAKSVNEVHAAQSLLQMLDVEGSVVTMDAQHVVRRTLEIITERGADVVVTVKKNVPSLAKDVAAAVQTEPKAVITTKEKERGRVATRRYEVFEANSSGYPMLKSIIRVSRENVSHASEPQKGGSEATYASTLAPNKSPRIVECVRKRWVIENGLHYVLDMSFDEDKSRIRIKNAAENFSRVRHIGLNLLALLKTPKLSFPLKRATAAMDERYLARALKLRAT